METARNNYGNATGADAVQQTAVFGTFALTNGAVTKLILPANGIVRLALAYNGNTGKQAGVRHGPV